MSATPFTHLHVHSTYSDGLAHPMELIQYAALHGYTHIALTDHDTLDGHAALVSAARFYAVTPILGSEIRVYTRYGHGHAVVLPRTEDEYDALRWLLRHRPRITLGDLKRCGVVTSGCRGGIVPKLLAQHDYWSAQDALREYVDVLGPCFHAEVQPNFGPVLPWMLALIRALDVPVIATNDVHYLSPHDAVRHANPGLYFASPEQMRQQADLLTEAHFSATQQVATTCAWIGQHIAH